MDSNLNSAKQAIEAELTHARQGAAFYAARVQALEIALQQLANVDTENGVAPAAAGVPARAKGKATGAKRGRKPGSVAQADGASSETKTKGRKKGRRASSSSLPTTGREFWFGLVSDQPQSAVDISNAAVTALGIAPSQKREIQQLKQRVAPALASLVSTHHISDTGSGRQRRFFKSANQTRESGKPPISRKTKQERPCPCSMAASITCGAIASSVLALLCNSCDCADARPGMD